MSVGFHPLPPPPFPPPATPTPAGFSNTVKLALAVSKKSGIGKFFESVYIGLTRDQPKTQQKLMAMGESALTKLFDEEYDKLMAAVGGRNFRFVNAETYDAVIAGAAGSSARTFLNRAGLSCGNDGPIQKIVGEILSSIKCLPEYANRNTELKEISKRADWSSSVDYTSQDFSEEAKSHGIDTGANMDQIDEALDKYETTIGKLDDVERKEIISLANSVRELKEKPSPGKQVRLAKHIALSENGFRALCMIVGPHNIGIELKPYDEISKTRTAYFSYVKPETT